VTEEPAPQGPGDDDARAKPAAGGPRSGVRIGVIDRNNADGRGHHEG
jgi:hypothetical protein